MDAAESNAEVESVINQKIESHLTIENIKAADDSTLLCPAVHPEPLDSKHPTSKSKSKQENELNFVFVKKS